MSGETASRVTTRDGLGSDEVLSLFEDGAGDLWVGGYGGGLNRIRDGRVTHYGRREGLPDDDVGSIIDDRRGSLWLCSSRGVFTVALGDLARLDRGELKRLPVALYGLADGMRTPECNSGSMPAVSAEYDGKGRATRLYFATSSGVNYLDLDHPHLNHAVLCALEIQAFMRRLREQKEAEGVPFWELRLGIHTGSAQGNDRDVLRQRDSPRAVGRRKRRRTKRGLQAPLRRACSRLTAGRRRGAGSA